MATKVEQERADQICTDMARAAEIERTHREHVVQIDAEVATIEPNVGTMVVEAEMSGAASPAAELVDRLARLRDARGVAEQSAAAAFERQCELQHVMWHLEAAALRRQADDKRKAAAKHSVKTTELLAALREHEGVDYGVLEPNRGPTLHGDKIQGGATQIVYVPTPRSDLLHIEAAELDGQADAIEARTIPAGGQVIADSVGELLERVHELGLVRAPADAQIRDWAARVAASHAGRIEGVLAHDRLWGAAVRYRLTWRNGTIDTAHSEATLITRAQRVAEAWERTAPERTARRGALVEQLVTGLKREQPEMSSMDARDVARRRMREQLEPVEHAERRELEARFA